VEYELVYTRRAYKDIRDLDYTIRKRLKIALERLKKAPFHSAQKLINPAFGTYRLRIGDYRVIFDVDGDKIIVLRVGHRKDIYRSI